MTDELEGFAYEHSAASSPGAPVLLLLHGTGGDERQLHSVGRALAGDAALLAPRGPVVESDGVARFFRRIPTGDDSAYPFTFDEREVAQRADELAGFLEAAVSRHELGGRPVVAVGFSNGANMGSALLLLHPGLLRGAVLVAPMPVLDEPPEHDLSSSAAMLAGGRLDPIATPERVEAVASMLDERGASVRVHWHDGGHDLVDATVDAARDWLDKLRRATAADPLP